MAIYGIGAHYGGTDDKSGEFIKHGWAGVGWDATDAPDLHRFIKSLAVGDIIYIKSFGPGAKSIGVLAIGFISDDVVLDLKATKLVEAGRNVVWKVTKPFSIPTPKGKNNVRLNTMYQEFHPEVQAEIIKRL